MSVLLATIVALTGAQHDLMPMPPVAAAPKPKAAPAACPPEHAAMGHCNPAPAKPAADPHAGHVMPAAPAGTALPAGNAPAPTPPAPDYADRFWGRDAMAGPRAAMRREHGGMNFSQVMIDRAEVGLQDGRDGYRWEGEGWFGGDVDRLVVSSEGGGTFGGRVDRAEVQALYSRAIDPYFNLQAGIRQDIGRGPSPTYATVALSGLAPYWFDVEGALFVSTRGDVLARIEGSYDQRLSQRLILQPRAEMNLAAQKGAGPTDVELGLRLRYEIAREFAPYVGVSWERQLGRSARLARVAGDDVSSAGIVLGIRAWF